MTRRSALLAAAAASAPLGWAADDDARRGRFLKLIDRPRVPLAPEFEEALAPVRGFERSRFQYSSEAGQRVPGILLKPTADASGRKLPVIVALHGTGGNKEGQLALLEQAAARGYAGIAIDGRYHGERAQGRRGSTAYVEAILAAWRGSGEHPFLYDTVWDILRLIDVLESRPDIDAKRIGMIGFSKGGMELYLAAAVDPRIAVSVPCIGVQSFRWAIDNGAWQSRAGTFQAALDAAARDAGKSAPDAAFLRTFYDKVVPGLYGDFDGPAMAPLAAPRPLLAINGDSDPRTPMAGLRECAAAAERAYREADAADRFRLLVQPKTGHKVNPDALEQALAWFDRWLLASA